jgi:hypothetical protein
MQARGTGFKRATGYRAIRASWLSVGHRLLLLCFLPTAAHGALNSVAGIARSRLP